MTTTDTPEGANLTMHILDRHVELATWIESGEAIQWFESYLVSHGENRQQGPFDDVPEAAAMYAEKVSRMLGLAETYWVAPDMADLIEQAAPTIERLPLRQHVIPSRYGFLQYPKTMVLGVDEHDEPWGVDAVSWAIADSDDDMTQWYDLDNVAHEAPGLFIIWWVEMARELQNRPERYAPVDVPSADLSWAAPAHITAWTFDLDWADYSERTFTVDAVGELQRKLLMTTFQLLGDELVKVWQEHAGRGARRRAARALKTPQPGDVHIVDLRKTRVLGKPEPEERDEPVLWTHRWIVRGHWRTLHRGDSNKEKQVYVRQHVKGPDDRPLIVKDRLSRLVR